MPQTDSVILARHFETSKNLYGLHGTSQLNLLTTNGQIQAEALARRLRREPQISRVFHIDTPQAEVSAAAISARSNLVNAGPIRLAPFNLGTASGLTHDALRMQDPETARSLDLFRVRAIDALKLRLAEGDSAEQIETRLRTWWSEEGSEILRGSLIVGTNSTLIMITNFLLGALPTSGKYFAFGIPNGASQRWIRDVGSSWCPESPLSLARWPEVESSTHAGPRGFCSLTTFYAGWRRLNGKCIILPGYFGNSRGGPYGLYSRLASALAFHGIESFVTEYPGFGESAPVSRSFDGDIESVLDLASRVADEHEPVVFVGHSLASAAAAELAARARRGSAIVLAPLVEQEELVGSVLDARDDEALRGTGKVWRRGVSITRDYIESASKSWGEYAGTVYAAVLAADDQYAKTTWEHGGSTVTLTVPQADHNFSAYSSSDSLIQSVVKLAVDQIANGA